MGLLVAGGRAAFLRTSPPRPSGSRGRLVVDRVAQPCELRPQAGEALRPEVGLDRLGSGTEARAGDREQALALVREPDQERATVLRVRRALGVAAALQATDSEEHRREWHRQALGE